MKLSPSPPKFTFYDKDTSLFIIVNLKIFTFNGTTWNNITIDEKNLPNTDFPILRRPSVSEIYQEDPTKKSLIVTGGFNLQTKSSSKSVYILNIFHDKTDKTSKAFLDLKYNDTNTGRFLHSSANIANKLIIIIGGKNEKGYINTCEYLDLVSQKWNAFPSLQNPRANHSTTVINDNKLYVYGGYESNGVFVKDKLCYCDVNISQPNESKWISLELKMENDNLNTLPNACACIYPYEDNFIICGGTNGEHLLNGIFEVKIDDIENEKEVPCEKLGELKTPRSNFHMFMKDGDFYVVGGSLKEYLFNEDKKEINNYIEKFTFSLSGKIDSENIKVNSDDLILPLLEMNINTSSYKTEPGFPFNASILSKDF